ncbi:4-alpha-glucanotransferase, partial [bacterium]|nr:4-alpha-glucanotransferase [bacterium]
MKIQKIDQQTFGRKPNTAEMKVYTQSINSGLKLLNKEIDIIIHNASFPSLPKENTGIGSMFSRTTLEKLIPFLKQHGIKGIQGEPDSMRKIGDFSPYSPQSSAKNIFMIPLEKLASDEYKNLLSKETFEKIVNGKTKSNNTNYKYVSENYEIALRETYENFKKGEFLKEDFKNFKSSNGEYLEKAAIFRILDKKYKTDWSKWPGIDKKLYAPETAQEIKLAKKRIQELKREYHDEIDFFIFNQFIIEKEYAKLEKAALKARLRIIGDSPVASPAADEWINQNLYLEGKALGCPPDYFAKGGQRWGFKYFDPEKIFNPDGTLGDAGKIMKQKYEDYFANFPGGLRIDHVIGLVDPCRYTTGEEMTSRSSGRSYSL